MHIKEVVKKLTCALNKRRSRRSVACDPFVIKCTERVATLKRRLVNLKNTIATTSGEDTATETAQRIQTVRCIEDRLDVARKARDQCKAGIVVMCKKKANVSKRTLDESTLLNMLKHLLDRCNTELRGGESEFNNYSSRVAALWCEGEAIIAQSEGRFSVANLRRDKPPRSKNSKQFQPKPFINKVRRREFITVVPKRSGAAPPPPPPPLPQPIIASQ